MFNFFCLNKRRRNVRSLMYNLVNYEEARNIIENPNNIVIDVRNPNEYSTMHIKNAVNIPVQNIRMYENEYSNKEKIMVYCSTGNRAKEAIRILNSMGYTNIYIWEYGSLSNFPYKDMINI